MEALGISPIGAMDEATTRSDPGNGWLLCDGRAVSRTTFASLFAALVPALGAVTITASSPTFTLAAHGLVVGDQVYFTGTVPAGLSANTIYYVRTVPSSSTFTVTTTAPTATPATWVSGSADVTPTASGTPTLMSCPYGLGDGTTTFNLPDTRGRIPFAPDNMGTAQGAAGRLPNSHAALGRSETGAEVVTLASAESGMVGHNHGGATGTGNTAPSTTGSSNATSGLDAVHSHNVSGNTSGVSGDHTHNAGFHFSNYSVGNAPNFNMPDGSAAGGTVATSGPSVGHQHGFSGAISGSADHGHTYPMPSLTMPSLTVPSLTITTEARAAVSAHNNVPPVLAACQIIRAL